MIGRIDAAVVRSLGSGLSGGTVPGGRSNVNVRTPSMGLVMMTSSPTVRISNDRGGCSLIVGSPIRWYIAACSRRSSAGSIPAGDATAANASIIIRTPPRPAGVATRILVSAADNAPPIVSWRSP